MRHIRIPNNMRLLDLCKIEAKDHPGTLAGLIIYNFILTKFSYKIGGSLRLQLYLIYFYWRWILTNPSLEYIFFLYPSCLQNF